MPKTRPYELHAIRELITDVIEAIGNGSGLLREAIACEDEKNAAGANVCVSDAQDCFSDAERALSDLTRKLAVWQEVKP